MKKASRTELEEITDLLIKFRDERNWDVKYCALKPRRE